VIRFVPANAQHVGSRQNQQDSFGFSDLTNAAFIEHGGFVAIVADGMGGLSHGDAASRLAVKAFLETYATKMIGETIPETLFRSLQAANNAVFGHAVSVGSPGDVGTTLIAVALQPEGLYWISVGDSTIYLHRNGTLIVLTTSHIYGHVLDQRVERGEISVEQARSDPQREALTSYVGAQEIAQVDRNVRPFPIQVGDMIVLASDGLFKTLPESEIVMTLNDHGIHAADELVRKTLATQREHQDNVTVCIVRVEDAATASSKPPISAASAVTWSPNDDQRDVATVESPVAARTPAPTPPRPMVQKPSASTGRLAGILVACVLFAIVGCYFAWRLMSSAPDPAGSGADPASVQPVLTADPSSVPQQPAPAQAGNPASELPPAPPPPPPPPETAAPASKQETPKKPARRSRQSRKETTGQE
jgi:serine/threonine protein phosphatase PrpC